MLLDGGAVWLIIIGGGLVEKWGFFGGGMLVGFDR